jgi:type II secretory ATPase GspE/PulE/Tfp pilus assembly ATPase PilB-like protein
MELNSAIRELAFSRAPLNEIRRAARAAGMRTLLEDGRLKILAGRTTAEELVRITQTADLMAE